MKSIPACRLSPAERDRLAADGYVVREAVFTPAEVDDMIDPLHQDYPYWVGVAQDPTRVATSMLFLDDANLDNACLRVVPASHTSGVWKTRTDEDQFATNEIDGRAYEAVESVPLEVPAGSVVMFGSYLVHHSHPNTSSQARRALLFSYQPPGAPHMLESLRRLGAQYRTS